MPFLTDHGITSLSLLGAVAMLAACGKKPAPAAGSAASAVKAAPISVAVANVEERQIPRYLRATGQLTGAQDARVAADVAGKVLEAPVERGTAVKAGDLLIKLDDRNAVLTLREADASVAATQAKLAYSEGELARNQPLAKAKAIAEMSFQRLQTDQTATQAELAAAVARRDLAKKAAADCLIVAPFAGVVAERSVSVGEFVTPGFPILRLVQIDRLRLVMNVPEYAVGQIKEGQKVNFTVASHPNETFTGAVKFIGPALRESSRDLLVEAEVPNSDARLKPGLFAEARLLLEEHQALAAPASAVRSEGARRSLFVVRDGIALEHLVEVGETADGWVEIRKGAARGDVIVAQPPPALADGMETTSAKPN